MLSSEYKTQILHLFSNIEEDDEFEVMFNNYKQDNILPLVDFMNVMKYIKYRSDKDKLKLYETISLDISYNEYRITIKGLDIINNFLGLVYQRKNNNIIAILITQYLDKDGFTLIKKIKEKSDKIDVNNLDIRFRKAKELVINSQEVYDMLSSIPSSDCDKIYFRYKQRLTLELESQLLIDMTMINSSDNVSNISNSIKTYELELDYSPKKKITKKQQDIMFNKILTETEIIKKIMQKSDIILTKEEEANIIDKYKTLVYGNTSDTNNMLYSMQPISTEVQHIIDTIPNKYSVTDKADGEKYQLFIYDNETYLISNNLHVRKLNHKIKDMNNTIIEGELIHIADKNRYIFMMFDCLYYKNEDTRVIVNLAKRLAPLLDITKKYGVEPYNVVEYNGEFDMNNIRKYYTESIKSFYTNLNKNIAKLETNDVLFYPKLFLYPSGGNPSECFLFADLIWLNCTKNTNIDCPYVLDGIIFTPLEQRYTKDKKEQRYMTYKYKPPHTNSLDSYIIFEKNKETGGYMDIYDNSIPNTLPFNSYRMINLYVGEMIGGKEQPTPFMKETLNNIIYLPIKDNRVCDIEGNIVLNKNVVELIYTNDIAIPHPYRWSILRTRWDKTESVLRYNKRYGNYKDVAEKVWKSMIEAVTIDEINNLANPKTYDMQMKILKTRLDSSVIISERQQDIYYQKVSNLVKKLREFHNWIKSIILYTYCSPAAHEIGGNEVRQSLLDIGCGRGGDLLKIYHARVGEYVGIDNDFDGIYSATNGAISRFKHLKSKFPNFSKVTYIQADGSVPLNSEAQSKCIQNLSKENKESLDRIFTKNKSFDNISSQFVIHYLFGNQTSINNLVDNIKTYLRKDGYILLTLFDPERIEPLFDANGKITSTYTDKEGQRTILYEIVKKYTGGLKNDVGQPIDVYMSWISEEGKYIEEYLVTQELMTSTMKKAGCRLVDTDLFANVYTMNKPYFENVIKYEENPKNKQFYDKVAEFFSELSGADKESKNYSFLFRYYIFQKME